MTTTGTLHVFTVADMLNDSITFGTSSKSRHFYLYWWIIFGTFKNLLWWLMTFEIYLCSTCLKSVDKWIVAAIRALFCSTDSPFFLAVETKVIISVKFSGTIWTSDSSVLLVQSFTKSVTSGTCTQPSLSKHCKNETNFNLLFYRVGNFWHPFFRDFSFTLVI